LLEPRAGSRVGARDDIKKFIHAYSPRRSTSRKPP
jgi:hypothetical protein